MAFFLKARIRSAIESDNIAKLDALLENGKHIEIDLTDGSSPLYYAAVMGREGIVAHLLAKGAVVDSPNDSNWTPLHRSAFSGHLGIVVSLLNAGADPNLRTSEGKTAYGVASMRGQKEVAEVLQVYLKKPSDHLVPSSPSPDVAETPVVVPDFRSNDGWTLMSETHVAHTLSNEQLGYKLTDVFDFRASERIRIVNNIATNRDQIETCSFDVIADKTILEEAFNELSARGGKADARGIHGGIQKAAAKLRSPEN